jgi:hypothetical protein
MIHGPLVSHAEVVMHRPHHLRRRHVVAHLMRIISLVIEPHGPERIN